MYISGDFKHFERNVLREVFRTKFLTYILLEKDIHYVDSHP